MRKEDKRDIGVCIGLLVLSAIMGGISGALCALATVVLMVVVTKRILGDS